MIVKKAKGYYVLAADGKVLGGPYKTKLDAAKRLSEIEYFKRKGK